MDSNGNTTGSSYDPGAIMWTPPNSFGHNSTSGATATEDPSGNFFTITDQTKGESMTVFGTQNGMFAMDGTGGAVIGLPQASSKDFDPTVAGTYSAIYYQKVDAQMQNNVEVGTPSEGKATVVVDSSGGVTIIDNQSNTTLANGTLVAIADDTDLYDGSTSKLSSPCNGLFTFVATGTTHQETFVTFVSNAVIFSGFETAWPAVNNGTYTYFYGVGLK
jgi:hypothetical protein